MTDAGLDRLIDLMEKGSPMLVHGCFTKTVPMGCLASHVAWNHPATSHLTVDAGINWLHRVAGLSEHYELHVGRDAVNDFVTVKVEARGEVGGDRYGSVGREAEAVFKSVIGVSIGVEVQTPGSLPRYELKAKRFFDHRPAEHRWQLTGGPGA